MSEHEAPQPMRPNFPQMEEEISAFWEKQDIFARSISERSEAKTYVAYDGPPFANALPHYGHLLQSAIKDAVPRYWTMQGYRVPRRWGWDCHGLPVETLIEKELNLNSKRDIEAYGIDKFNDACRASVMKYASEWKKYVTRLGRWVEFDNAYKTMDASYTESVWWAFAELWKKKLVYKDLRVSLYCPRCATPLSNFEIAMDNSYVELEDPAITVKFKVKGEENTYFLVWTTTPWTLPANVALAVHPDQLYVKVKLEDTGETLIFAEALQASVLKQYFPLDGEEVPFEVLGKMKGSELVGMEYEPLYPLPAGTDSWIARAGENWYRVVAMGYVTVEDGTGIVHTAPAFGEEDFMASKAHDLPVVSTVDDEGRQKSDVAFGAGLKVKESDPLIVEDLRGRGFLYREDRITHSVAVCWRCSTHLLYKAQPAWFVNVTKLKPKLLDAAKKIEWHPEHFKEGRFGKGLETAPDWNISRTRFWGAPLPVWTCDSCDEMSIFGSVAELEEGAGKKFPRGKEGLDLHRPKIDELTFGCTCGGTMRRVPEVFDCWFESGSMPYASEHYPYDQKDWFDGNFPADFIAEGQDQTRGWFYSLHVLASALFGKPAFKNSIVTGLFMAEDGKKMSKRLKNYPDPWELMTRLGADTLRFYMLSSSVIQAESPNFSERDCETLQRSLFGTLWNIGSFYGMYTGDGQPELSKPRSMHVLDRWLMARLHKLIKETTEAMNSYDLVGATRPLRSWVDDLSTWWLRRSRERIKSKDMYERQDALKTLREALLETSALLAPFSPFFAEKMYQDFGGSKMSVHLDRWPKVDERQIDEQLLADMEWVRKIATAGNEARATAKIPVRQALAKLLVSMKSAMDAARLNQRSELTAILCEELNVEQIVIMGGAETNGEDWTVTLDTVITPELKRKGMGRELSRRIMNLRKEMGLTPTDMINVAIAAADHGLRDTIESLLPTMAELVHASGFHVGDSLAEGQQATLDFDLQGDQVSVGITKV